LKRKRKKRTNDTASRFPLVTQPIPKTYDDVRKAFDNGRILEASRTELEQLLLALGRENTTDIARQARAAEMGRTMRQLLAAKRNDELQRRPSRVAALALLVALAALLCSAGQGYYYWKNSPEPRFTSTQITEAQSESASSEPENPSSRVQPTLLDLAKRAPTLRTGTVQAWWAGEQARQVIKLEAQARRQLLAGDREGAAQSAGRAEALRSGIEPLASFEKPAVK
jgi:hypothetical protein